LNKTPAILTEDFRDFIQSLPANIWIIYQLGHCHLPNSFQVIIHLTSGALQYSLDADGVIEKPTKEKVLVWLSFIHSHNCGSTALYWTLAAFSVPLYFTQSVGFLGWGISLLQGHDLYTGQNKHMQISMPQVGFESMIPVFKWAKTVLALNHAATAIGCMVFITNKYITV
jgi:hypothetical protein